MQLQLPQSFFEQGAVIASRARMSPDEFWDFCVANPGVRMELTAKGEVIVAPPAGWISGFRDIEAAGSLRAWAKRNKTGEFGGPTSSFLLPSVFDSSPRSPNS